MPAFPVLETLDVQVVDNGVVVIRADSYTAARLAGRNIFGAISETQKELEERIADAWYAADCPRRDPA